MELVFLACSVGVLESSTKNSHYQWKNRLKYQILFTKKEKKSLDIPNKHKKLLTYNHSYTGKLLLLIGVDGWKDSSVV